MIRFKSYITEVAISEHGFAQVVEIFKKFLERKLSTKLYRYGGKDGIASIGKYQSVLYFYDRTKAISFNYSKGNIETISLWDRYKLGAPGDYTIELNGLNLIKSANKIIDVIAKRKTGTYQISESAELINEAKRTTPVDFYNLVKRSMPDADLSSMSLKDMKSVASSFGVLIPSVIYSYKSGKGLFNLNTIIAGDDKPTTDTVAPNAAGKNTDYFIKVTPYRDGKFQTAKDDPYAKNLLNKINNSISKPDFKVEMKDPNTLFGHMAALTKVVASGTTKSLVIYGGPGIGKCVSGSEKINVYTTPT